MDAAVTENQTWLLIWQGGGRDLGVASLQLPRNYFIFRDPSSEATWSPIVSVTFFFFLKFCKSHTAAYTVS